MSIDLPSYWKVISKKTDGTGRVQRNQTWDKYDSGEKGVRQRESASERKRYKSEEG
jgi:hypothetical protein